MTRKVRSDKVRNGLVLANGGVLSYQHAICLSSRPRKDGSPYPDSRSFSDNVVGGSAPVVEVFAEGKATIEVSMIRYLPSLLTAIDTSCPRLTRSSLAEMASQKQPSLLADCRAMVTVLSRIMEILGR